MLCSNLPKMKQHTQHYRVHRCSVFAVFGLANVKVLLVTRLVVSTPL